MDLATLENAEEKISIIAVKYREIAAPFLKSQFNSHPSFTSGPKILAGMDVVMTIVEIACAIVESVFTELKKINIILTSAQKAQFAIELVGIIIDDIYKCRIFDDNSYNQMREYIKDTKAIFNIISIIISISKNSSSLQTQTTPGVEAEASGTCCFGLFRK